MQCELRAKRGRAGRYAMMGVIASVRATWESDFERYPAVRPLFHDLGFAQPRRCGAPQRLDIEGRAFRIAGLLRQAFPHCADRSSAFHHAGPGRKCGRVIGVERGDAGEIAFEVWKKYGFPVGVAQRRQFAGRCLLEWLGHKGGFPCRELPSPVTTSNTFAAVPSCAGRKPN